MTVYICRIRLGKLKGIRKESKELSVAYPEQNTLKNHRLNKGRKLNTENRWYNGPDSGDGNQMRTPNREISETGIAMKKE